MLSDFFQIGAIPGDQLLGTYDFRLVILSYLVAVFASYIALDFTGRLRDQSNTKTSSLLWLMGGSVAMGAGIWSMHFIGMLSFSMPHMMMKYEPFWTSISLIVAIAASAFALFLLKAKMINRIKLAIGGFFLGIAIASMHYTGMEAMKINMDIHYLPGLFLLSIIIAIFASEVALWLALKSNQVRSRLRVRLKVISASIMGLAICGMHYTGMVAAIFTPKMMVMSDVPSINPDILSISIAGVTFVILGIAFFASTYKEALSQQQLQAARQLGMAEVAVSVLHNVGNVLNSINVSANLIAEKINKTEISSLQDICDLLNKHKEDLGDFITNDINGRKIPLYLNKLAEYWHDEQSHLTTELNSLLKNIQHIKDIVSVQQGISKTQEFEQMVAMDEVLNETLLITGLEVDKNGIIIKKNYEKVKTVLIDKVKLLQILVNLLTNAKESLRESTNSEKIIYLTITQYSSDKVTIIITDTGVGISADNLKKIFLYGFTTKESGHGFGLHNCAISANEMGGSIKIESEGVEKGVTVVLELPYTQQKLKRK